ncbi:MAG TPA: transposase [Opitutales bacterium]|nr:transposase [Opitutales bacterium]
MEGVPKLPVRKNLPHDPPSWVPGGEIFFVTICVADRKTQPLANPQIAQSLLASARHNHDQGNWWIRLFLIMPDHVHGLLAFPPAKAMRKVIAAWKSYTAKTTGISWQQDFFDHRIRNLAALEEKELYILNNPMRKNLVKNTSEWPWLLRQRDLLIKP